MNETVKISVIIPVYNIRDYLERCVSSVTNQTYHNLEIILVDDGSTDGSDMICDRFAEQDERIVVIHKENGGLSDARNAGIDRASGEFISFIDGDDYIESNMYEVMIQAVQDDIPLVVCGIRALNSEGVCLRDYVWNRNRNEVLTQRECFLAFMAGNYNGFDVASWNKLYRRDLFENIRFLKGIISEDIECLYRILDKVDKCVCVKESLYVYVQREGSITNSGFYEKQMDVLYTLRKIVTYIEMKHPDLSKAAYRFELRWLFNCWKLVQNAEDKEVKKKWEKRIRRRIRLNLRVNGKRKEIGNYQFVMSHAILLGCDKVTEKMFKRWFAVKAQIKEVYNARNN